MRFLKTCIVLALIGFGVLVLKAKLTSNSNGGANQSQPSIADATDSMKNLAIKLVVSKIMLTDELIEMNPDLDDMEWSAEESPSPCLDAQQTDCWNVHLYVYVMDRADKKRIEGEWMADLNHRTVKPMNTEARMLWRNRLPSEEENDAEGLAKLAEPLKRPERYALVGNTSNDSIDPADVAAGGKLPFPDLRNSSDTECSPNVQCTGDEFRAQVNELKALWPITPQEIQEQCAAPSTAPEFVGCILRHSMAWLNVHPGSAAPWIPGPKP